MYKRVIQARISTIFLVLVLLVGTAIADTPGLQLLHFPFSPRSAAMGGTRAASPTQSTDINGNPAGLAFQSHLQGQASVVNHLVGIKGYGLQGLIPLEAHTLAGDLIYFDYGIFERTDETGTTDGTFGFHELSTTFSYAYRWRESMAAGARVGRFLRVADGASEDLFYYDLGLVYSSDQDSLIVGLMVLAIPLGDSGEALPSQVRVGTSKVLEHLPVRLNLEGGYAFSDRYDLALGAEILIHPSFQLRMGVNSNRVGLQTDVTSGDFVAGASYGFAFRFKGMRIEMANQSFGDAGWVNQMSLSLRL